MFGGKTVWRLLASCVLSGAILWLIYGIYHPNTSPAYGFTYSFVYAESLGLDGNSVLRSALADFQPDFVRLPVYWNRVEPEPNVYRWDETDAAVALLHAAQTDIHMTVGVKAPRWPECFVPSWISSDETDRYRGELLAYIEETVMRYAPNVRVWQVENEPFFAFGECGKSDIALLQEEIALVRRLDPDAVIQLTVSGEQQAWTSVAPLADQIGVSMYRTVQSARFGSFSLPLSPDWYRLMSLPLIFTHKVSISELQMEPWFTQDPRGIAPLQASLLFTSLHAQEHIAYARASGFTEVSFWGVEWWYYLQQQGYPDLLDTMKEVMK